MGRNQLDRDHWDLELPVVARLRLTWQNRRGAFDFSQSLDVAARWQYRSRW